MISVALQGGLFEKRENMQNQECDFLKMASYPILIPDSESTSEAGYIGIKDMF